MSDAEQQTMPAEVDSHTKFFDRLADAVSRFASKATFFALCVMLVVVWAPTIFFLTMDTWQLIINTITTIITFLLVALLQNTSTRADGAVQKKLNALACAQLLLLKAQGQESSVEADQLRAAIGLELRESAD